MKQVFISYSSKDEAKANEIVKALENQGIACWIAPRDIRVGSNYTKDIPSAIRECPCFLLVLSRRSQDSRWVNKELTRAIKQDKRIMPLMIEDFTVDEGFEFLLEDVQTRPYYQEKAETLKEVSQEIRALVPGAAAHEEKNHAQAAPAAHPKQPEPDIPKPKGFSMSPAEMYQKGEKCFTTSNYNDAITWYHQAATRNYAPAQHSLAWCYENGYGISRDYQAAVTWYRKAAEQGYARSQHNLGCCYSNGVGVNPSWKTALHWWMKAAEQGFPASQFNVGINYEYGVYVERDLDEARKWYRAAVAQGYEPAQKALERLK